MRKKHTSIILLLLISMISLNCTDELDMTRLERGKNASQTSITGNNAELESKKGIGMA